MSDTDNYPNFSQYRTVSEAAAFLGVSTTTLRNWDRSGKLTPRRHPQNGYRIYLVEDLQAVLRSADRSTEQGNSPAPQTKLPPFQEHEHCIQFYESEAIVIESVVRFISDALNGGHACVSVYSRARRDAIEQMLVESGVNLKGAIQAGRYLEFDPVEALSLFMIDGMPDRDRFFNAFSDDLARLSENGRRIFATGEMAAHLWINGNRDAAFRLEELWNELSERYPLTTLCPYPMHGFEQQTDATPLGRFCQLHSRVIPAESYSGIQDTVEQSGAVVLLQHTVQCLKAELARRDSDRSLN